MGLTEDDRKEIVKYRMEKARETLAEISILMENKFYRTAANRLYYACFYAATALLINDGEEAHTHSGVKVLLGRDYIKENKIEKEFGRMYSNLFGLRQTGDYEDRVIVKEENIKPYLQPAKEFIEKIEQLILTK